MRKATLLLPAFILTASGVMLTLTNFTEFTANLPARAFDFIASHDPAGEFGQEKGGTTSEDSDTDVDTSSTI
jgi:hypothetical protein